MAGAGSARGQSYRLPLIECEKSGGCYVTAYYDLNRTSGTTRDWNCRTKTYDQHSGTDLGIGGFAGMDANGSRPIVAGAAGTVVAVSDGAFDRQTSASNSTCGTSASCGNYVKLKHADGKQTIYCHMKKGSVAVAKNQQVSCGTVLGRVGSSGCSTGPHLHFGVYTTSGSHDCPYKATTGCGGALSYWVSQGAYLGLPAPTCECTPSCSGKACGSDGCGGSCGTCAAGTACDGAGRCVCAPACAGKQCGSDGCGGSCGTCAAGTACDSAGRCVCAPDCAGKQCGSDGCGGSCGSCAAGTACDGAGRCACAPDCAGRACGSDGCGGSCGSCAPGLACDEGTGQCVCAPDCAGKACGPDGCGGSCGECAAGQKCDEEGRCEGAVASPDAGASGDGGPARPPPVIELTAGCGCQGGAGDAASWAAGLLVLGAFAGRRRQR